MSKIGLPPHQEKLFGVDRERASRIARQHELLTADFRASGIDPDRFGFYDQPAFLARERICPDYIARYAEWVLTRPISSAYDAHARATVPKLAHLISASFATCDARGRCLAATAMVTQMLDQLQVWSFGLVGSVVIEASAQGLRRSIHTIALKGGPRGIAGHAWVVAPPFLIVDASLALQHWDSAIAPLIPDVVLAGVQAPIVHARVEDCVSDRVRELFAQAEGWHDPRLHHRLDLRLGGFLRSFPAREVRSGDTRIRFVPVMIEQPCEALAQIELAGDEWSGQAIWNSIVGPAFGMVAFP